MEGLLSTGPTPSSLFIIWTYFSKKSKQHACLIQETLKTAKRPSYWTLLEIQTCENIPGYQVVPDPNKPISSNFRKIKKEKEDKFRFLIDLQFYIKYHIQNFHICCIRTVRCMPQKKLALFQLFKRYICCLSPGSSPVSAWSSPPPPPCPTSLSSPEKQTMNHQHHQRKCPPFWSQMSWRKTESGLKHLVLL